MFLLSAVGVEKSNFFLFLPTLFLLLLIIFVLLHVMFLLSLFLRGSYHFIVSLSISVSFSLSLYLSPYISGYILVHLYISACLCLSISLSLSISVSVFFPYRVVICASLFICLSLHSSLSTSSPDSLVTLHRYSGSSTLRPLCPSAQPPIPGHSGSHSAVR